jgi:ribonuclease-3
MLFDISLINGYAFLDLFRRETDLSDLSAFQQSLGVSFNQPELLTQALTHSSYANENPSIAPVSNERLEFLGDAVLGLVVGEQLYRDYPELSEGQMTKLRAHLVKQETLAVVAKGIGLGAHLYLGKGEEGSGGSEKPANLARGLEAVIAAVYLDQGAAIAAAFVWKLLQSELQSALSTGVVTDFKSRLQEFLQGQTQSAPSYHLVETTGPDHDRTFVVEVRSEGETLAQGIGKNKKSAEAEAARLALEKLTGQQFEIDGFI